jgi:hypothetical protein
MVESIPKALSYLIALNVKFQVFVCLPCKIMVKPSAFILHLKDIQQTLEEEREKVISHFTVFTGSYDSKTIQLPSDGTAPQAIITILVDHLYKLYPYKTQKPGCNQITWEQGTWQAEG